VSIRLLLTTVNGATITALETSQPVRRTIAVQIAERTTVQLNSTKLCYSSASSQPAIDIQKIDCASGRYNLKTCLGIEHRMEAETLIIIFEPQVYYSSYYFCVDKGSFV